MIVKTKAIVFSSIKYADADLIVTCFTEEFGIQSYLLRSILKSKKSSLRASFFQPLTQLDLVVTHRNKGKLEYIREAKVISPYETLHTDLIKTSLVMFLAEILKSTIREEEANPELFEFLIRSFQWLDKNEEVSNFHIYFLLRLSFYLGVFPDDSHKEYAYFNILEGRFQEFDSDSYSLKGDYIEYFKLFFNIEPDHIGHINLSKNNRADLLNFLLSYYQLHVQGFKKPKSLSILNELFS